MNNNRGFSLLEIMMAVGLTGLLALVGFNLYNFANKETAAISEDVQTMVARFGASRVLTRDISGAEPSFNYINLNDDEGLPFFTLAKNEYCRHEKCDRKYTLELKAGQTRSKSIYFIVKKSYVNEIQKLSVHPSSVFKADNSFGGINWQHKTPNSINKSNLPESPWTEGRIMMLSSEIDFFDCNTTVFKMNNMGTCNITCSNSGTCDFAVKRPLKMLGVVKKAPSDDMNYYPIKGQDNLLVNKYRICRPDKNYKCAGTIDISSGLNTTKKFYENLPFVPGTDDRTVLSPVEVVEYYLERPTKDAPDHQVQLKRARAVVSAKGLVFEKSLGLMSGIQSIVFSRTNVSNPVIEYKLRKVRMKKSLK